MEGAEQFRAGGPRFCGLAECRIGGLFSTLGVQPLLGRLIQPADVALYAGMSARVAVLDYRCWQSRFQGDPNVVGKTIRLNDQNLTIIGVTPKTFAGLAIDVGEDVIVPIGVSGGADFRERKYLGLRVYGRLKPGGFRLAVAGATTGDVAGDSGGVRTRGYTGARRDRFYARKVDLESAATGQANMRGRLSETAGGADGFSGNRSAHRLRESG